jgi:hypothetical protein
VTREKSKPAVEVPQGEIPQSTDVLAELERILATPLFQNSKRYPALLRHVVEQTLAGSKHELKERTLGIVVFRRPPEYDTSADPVVRNTASEVRKRLEEYYSEPGHEGEVVITLPSGTYVPEFRVAAVKAAPLVPTLADPVPPPAASRRLPRWAIAAPLVALAIVTGVALFPRPSAVKVFWAPILKAPDPVLVVVDTWLGVADPQAAAGNSSQVVRELIDPKVFLKVNDQSARLGAFLGSQGRHVEHALARDVTLSNLRTRPFILRGAFNNSWTLRAVSPFRFYFQLDHDPLVRRIMDRQHPERHDWAAPMSGEIKEDYALIARATEPDAGQMMLVIAGLGDRGSAAALEFATNPKYLTAFSAEAPAGWERRNMELVIKTNLVKDDWGEPRIVATHFW